MAGEIRARASKTQKTSKAQTSNQALVLEVSMNLLIAVRLRVRALALVLIIRVIGASWSGFLCLYNNGLSDF